MGEALVWRPEYSVGREDIDEQHKRLISTIAGLKTALDNDAQVEVDHLLNALAQYTVYHFNYEEELFRTHGYPQSDTHVMSHKCFVDRVLLHREELEQGLPVDLDRLSIYLQSWIVDHIMREDKGMVDWLKKQAR